MCAAHSKQSPVELLTKPLRSLIDMCLIFGTSETKSIKSYTKEPL